MSKKDKISLIMQGVCNLTIVVIYSLGCRRIDKIYERKLDQAFELEQK